MLYMYSIYDKKSQSFSQPMFYKHVAEATRSVQMTLETKEANHLNRFPGDYALYLIGTFDPATGGIMPPETITPQHTLEVQALMPGHNQAPMVPGKKEGVK